MGKVAVFHGGAGLRSRTAFESARNKTQTDFGSDTWD